MQDDTKKLEELNLRIGELEDEGNLAELTKIIAPEFAFRRANGEVVGGVAFLKAVKPNTGDLRHTEVASVDLQGDRAFVTCLVTMGPNTFHNLRLFVRLEGEWKILGWANAKL